MNPFLNPLFALKSIGDILADEYRIINWDRQKLEVYQSKKLKKIVRYATKVPIYRAKFEENGLHIKDINSVKDIERIPVMTRDDLRKGYPDDIIPSDFDRRKGKIVTTGGVHR